MTTPSVPPDNSIPPFNYEDIASQPLVEAMLTEMIGAPKPDGDNTVREAAKAFTLRTIEESNKLFCDPFTMGDLQNETWFFIEGYRQALDDCGERS